MKMNVRRRGNRSGLTLAAICLFFSAVVPASVLSSPLAQQNGDFRIDIVHRSSHAYVLRWKLEHFELRPAEDFPDYPLTRDGKIPVFSDAILLPSAGRPALPQTGFSLILPPGSQVTVEAEVDSLEFLSPLSVAFFPDTLSFPQNVPSGAIEFAGERLAFGLPFYAFQIHPFRYDSASRTLQVIRKMTIRIQISEVLPPVLPVSGREISFLRRLAKIRAVNGRDVRFVRAGKFGKAAQDTAYRWYDPGKPWIKLLVSEDGIYRVYGRDLRNLGVNLADIQPQRLQIFLKGKPIPVRVVAAAGVFDDSSFVEFPGQRNRGKYQYYNDYSDTLVYWLTWQADQTVRFPERSVRPRGGDLMKAFPHRQHEEKDNIYHSGDYALAIFDTDRSPGEGWIWERIYAGDEFRYFITAYNYAEGSALPDSFLARFHGITNDPVSPDHHLQVEINGTLVADFRFDGQRDYRLAVEIPKGVLKLGRNEVIIRSLEDTGARYDAVYFDWMEIVHPRQTVASGDYLFFVAPPQADRRLAQYYITNLHSRAVVLYDITNQVFLRDVSIVPSGDRFYAVFSDSVPGGTRYWLVGEGAIRRPARMVLDQPSHLRSPSQRADLIIITHRRFWAAAQELASYRSARNGIQVVVADIEDVLDEFNYGLMDPEAIRSFLAYAVNSWQPPAPQYVLLFGDASWDYKKQGRNSVKENFVPTYGNPVSDSRLVSLDGYGDFLPDLFVGRLPAETPAEAAEMVRKIKTYEAMPPAPWHKNIIFLNGGFNDWEQNLFRGQAEEIISTYVEAPPFGGNPVRIYKESDEMLVGEHRGEIMAAINRGALWLSFLGHAGSETWDLMLMNEDIYQLENGDRMPFITSMTCHTARFANPYITTFGELFLKVQHRGAIGFWGTTGWGYIFQDRVLINELFRLVLKDSVRTLGEATTLTRLHLWDLLGYSRITVASIDQYTLLGDPLLELAVPEKPDLAIADSTLNLTPEEPTQEDTSLVLSARIYNYGLVPEDSFAVQVRLLDEQGTERARRWVELPPVLYATDIQVELPLAGLVGSGMIEILLDPDDRVDELGETNNRAEIRFYVYSTSIAVASPEAHAVLRNSRPSLQVYTPEILGSPPRAYYFELDTVPDFSSDWKQASGPIPENPIVTRWRVPENLVPGHYFWRCRTEWQGTFSAWISGDFYVTDTDSFQWMETAEDLARSGLAESLTWEGNSIQLALDPSRAVLLEVVSAGFQDGSDCKLLLNYTVLNRAARGHHVVAISPTTGTVLAGPYLYDTYADTAAANAMADFIESMPEGTVIMAGIMDDGSVSMTERAYRALELIGSKWTRQVGFRDSWAIIGRKGATPGTVPEVWSPRGQGAAVVRDTLSFLRYSSGILESGTVGPATRWIRVGWDLEVPAGDAGFQLTVRGWDRVQGSWQDLLTVSSGSGADLSFIDANRYRALRLRMELQDPDGRHSPAFRSWYLFREPVPDLATHPVYFQVLNDSLLEGESLQVVVPVFNVGERNFAARDSSFVVEVERQPNRWQIAGVRALPAIPADDSVHVRVAIPTAGLRGPHRFRVRLDPEDQIPERSESNNVYATRFFVRKDTVRPAVRILFDGREILPGDLVSARPEIQMDILDNSPLAITDSALFVVYLDGERVPFGQSEEKLKMEQLPPQEPYRTGTRLYFRPSLEDGFHALEIFAKDATENPVYSRADFRVERRFRIMDVLNVPNPLSDETEITYTLTQPADQVVFSVYTLAGRLIFRETDLPGEVGFNHYRWVARDADGDRLANGVYLYRLEARSGGKTAAVIQKLIIMR